LTEMGSGGTLRGSMRGFGLFAGFWLLTILDIFNLWTLRGGVKVPTGGDIPRARELDFHFLSRIP
jgi:hypothetical protein